MKNKIIGWMHKQYTTDLKNLWNDASSGMSLKDSMEKHDKVVGLAIGALLGGTVGNYASKKLFNKDDSPLRRKIKKNLVYLAGIGAGATLGMPAGVHLGKTDMANKIYKKLGVLTQSTKLATRDMLGRMHSYLETEGKDRASRDAALVDLFASLSDYRDNKEMTEVIKNLK